ncbi:MAG: DNA polymerase III subunit epsilon [Thiotrichaceae bacterium]|nr:DNA polymerase III subunit epsilon [Thiotrichaceae bacterium]PCI14138.1 MAG: DNA polymerase III subunit epsilon [Thiotrichales bacterium]
MRQIILDTETTGLEPKLGHRIIEIGCVEVIDRRLTGRHYHQYLQPDRAIDDGAIEVHGITNEFLVDKPRFSDVAEDFIEFIKGAELVIHNAAFDVGFINHEFRLLSRTHDLVEELCGILDTLAMARKMHPGQRNSLDALCKRYDVDNVQRTLHGALLDAEILADVYLMMTGGQRKLLLGGEEAESGSKEQAIRRVQLAAGQLKVMRASHDELLAHEGRLAAIEKQSDSCVWRQLEQSAATEASSCLTV